MLSGAARTWPSLSEPSRNELVGKAPQPAFGAVYEYVDSCGTPVIASTATLPERQFALDRRHHEELVKSDPRIVWAGLSSGPAGLNSSEMTEVRRSVVAERAKR